MKKSIYIFLVLILFATTFIAFKIVSDDYDKQNQFILKIKEIVPTEIKNRLRGTVLNLRANIKKDENEKIQLAKKVKV